MKLLMLIYKNEMILCLLLLSLFLWAGLASIFAFQNKEKMILIGSTDGFYHTIEKSKQSSIETENFIRHFVALSLNFDKNSYRRNVGLAGDLMTDKLWREKQSEFKEMDSYIRDQKIIQSSEIVSIKKQKRNLFEIKIRNYLVKKGTLTETDKFILLSLIENKRSYENPWRHSVSNIEVK